MITQGEGSASPSADEVVRQLLGAHLGLPVSDEEFRFLDLQGALAPVQAAPEGSRQRAAAVREAAKVVRDLRTAQGQLVEAGPKEAGPMVAGDRQRRYALSRLLALEAERNPEVMSFRARHLEGGLLGWEQVEEWIKERAQTDGGHSQYVEMVLPAGATLKPTLSGLVAESSALLRDLQIEGGVKAQTLKYGLPGEKWVKVAPVRAGGVLDELRKLADRLADSYSWTKDQATVFVLTKVTPYMVGIRVETEIQTEHPAASKIRLEIDPVVAPQEVLKAYSELRQQVLKGTYRPLREKHLKLAVFAAERRPPAKWAQVMRAWNDEHPEYEYEKETVFARDCTAAQRRLLEPRLNPDALL